MFVPFNTLSPTSRIWVFQSNREFTPDEELKIKNILTAFTQEWAAHGQPLKSSFEIRLKHFVILAADESHQATSGCSVDESVRVIKHIQQQLGFDLFDRNLVAFKKGDSVSCMIPMARLKEKLLDGTWNGQTETFNNLVSVKSQLDAEWIVAAAKTWLKRYLSTEKVAT
jgi:hypothetical protein